MKCPTCGETWFDSSDEESLESCERCQEPEAPKPACPTRHQWRVLAKLRDGAAKYLHRPGGNLKTSMSVRKRGWVLYDEQRLNYFLSDTGRAALVLGDRRYQASEIAYAKRLL